MHTDASIAHTEHQLDDCFGKWRVREYDVVFNVPRPKAQRDTSRFEPAERGVTVWWRNAAGKRITMAMDRHSRPMDNLRVLFLAIDSIRLNEKRGIDDALMRSAYLQLTAGAGGDPDPYDVLTVMPGVQEREANAAYRRLALEAHPDTGGSDAAMQRLNRAWTSLVDLEGWA